jgi:hypothetical protein
MNKTNLMGNISNISFVHEFNKYVRSVFRLVDRISRRTKRKIKSH